MATSIDPHEEEVLGKAYDARLARRLLRYAWPYRALIGASLALLMIEGALQLVGPLLTRRVIDVALPARDGGMLARSVAIFVASLLAQFVCTYGQTILTARLGQCIMHDLRTQIFRHLQRLPVAFFDRNPVGRLVTRVTSDVESLNELFTSGVVAGIGDLFTLLAIAVLMWVVDWRLAISAFAVIPLVLLASNVFRVRVREAYRAIRTRLARINAFLQERLSGVRVVQLFGREGDEAKRFNRLNDDHLEAHLRSITIYALYFPVIEVLTTTAIASLVLSGGSRVEGGTLTVGTLAAFLQLVRRFFEPLQDLSDKYNTLQQAMASSERIFRLLDEGGAREESADEGVRRVAGSESRPELVAPQQPLAAGAMLGSEEAARVGGALARGALEEESGEWRVVEPRDMETSTAERGAPPKNQNGGAPTPVRHRSVAPPIGRSPVKTPQQGRMHASPAGVAIEFSHVWFAYASSHTAHGAAGDSTNDEPEWVLRDVSFRASPGETLAIVGQTGSGKTTIINLLLGFYAPQRGRILIDDVDIRDLDVGALRKLIGYVQQDIFLFAGDIATNIRLAADISDAAVVRAAQRVGADRIIQRLPGGYSYQLGERGASVSVGERQLLSFARAIAADPAVLVLDEATSAVDSEIEAEIQRALAELMRGRTTIAIAHRLSTVRGADEILVMHHGEVRERGTHRELLALRGLYERLYRLQAGALDGA
jgi:ATP-binding cassette, subfamily B, multidrug efflux pump